MIGNKLQPGMRWWRVVTSWTYVPAGPSLLLWGLLASRLERMGEPVVLRTQPRPPAGGSVPHPWSLEACADEAVGKGRHLKLRPSLSLEEVVGELQEGAARGRVLTLAHPPPLCIFSGPCSLL